MRALCESCDRPQPRDWRAGDLCIHCGQAVREEARCHWCAKWGPRGKFCRKCGSMSVPPERYGAARMLKEMGASVFEIPKLLAELDPELVETHEAIYATHAAAANRHIDDAVWLGGFLYQKHWAEELAEELIPQLPWPEEKLKLYTRRQPEKMADLDRARQLSESSPSDMVQSLAHLARLRMGDFSGIRHSANLLYAEDARLAAEAALQMTGWRALLTTYLEVDRYFRMELLERSPLPAHAAPRLAAMGKKPAPEYSLTGEPDTDFLIHVVDGNVDKLTEYVRGQDAMQGYAAAWKLTQLGYAERVGALLGRLDDTHLHDLLNDIVRAKRPVPALHPELLGLVERSENHRVARLAARAICLSADHAALLRLYDEGGNDHDIVQALLQSKAAPETLVEILWRLVRDQRLHGEQWGLDAAAQPGALPELFVEQAWATATDKVRMGLLRVAELQIEARDFKPDQPMEHHVMRQCFREGPWELVKEAWTVMSRVQMRRQVGRTVPCDLTAANVEEFWEMRVFLMGLAALLGSWRESDYIGFRDDLSRFLGSAGDEFFEAAARYPQECALVIAAAPSADPYGQAPRFAARLQAALH